MGIIKHFLDSIKNLIDKKQINMTIGNVHDVLDELKPVVDQVGTVFSLGDAKDADLKYITTAFYEAYGNRSGTRKNIFQDISAGILNAERNLEIIEEYVEKHLSNNSVGASLSLKKSFCIAYINNLEFAVDYIQHLVDFYIQRMTPNSKVLSKAEVEFVEKNIKRFANLFTDLAKPSDKFQKEFDKLVDVQVTDANDDILIHDNVSSFKLNNFMGFRYSPVFFIGKAIADYQVNKYKARKDKIKYLQLRLVYLENENKNTPDAKLEKEIEFLKNRIDKLESQNNDVERDLQEGHGKVL